MEKVYKSKAHKSWRKNFEPPSQTTKDLVSLRLSTECSAAWIQVHMRHRFTSLLLNRWLLCLLQLSSLALSEICKESSRYPFTLLKFYLLTKDLRYIDKDMQITVKILNGQEARLEVGKICSEKRNSVASYEEEQTLSWRKTYDIFLNIRFLSLLS